MTISMMDPRSMIDPLYHPDKSVQPTMISQPAAAKRIQFKSRHPNTIQLPPEVDCRSGKILTFYQVKKQIFSNISE